MEIERLSTDNSSHPDQWQREGWVIQPFKDRSILTQVESIVNRFFPEPENEYREWEKEKYQARLLACQSEINLRQIPQLIARSEKATFQEFLGKNFYIQNHGYLRGTRPGGSQEGDVIGFHRETFYGAPGVENGVSFWFPIRGVTPENSLAYIPRSHLIPEEEIKWEYVVPEKYEVAPNSTAHKIGFLYRPKKITGGVDLDSRTRFSVPPGHYVIFSGNLIHGSASNFSSTIRFSFDFMVVDQKMGKVGQKPHVFDWIPVDSE